jgi:N-acetylglucosamine-6-phosphate deacetylase
MNRATAVFAEFAQVPLERALLAGTRNPATLLGRGLCAELAEGQIANLVLFEPGTERLNIRAVALQGEVVYRSEQP